jgi:hypothetical protein
MVTLHFEPVPLTVRLWRGRWKVVLATVLVALIPFVLDHGAVLLGPGNGRPDLDRITVGAIIGFPMFGVAIAAITSVLKAGRGCTVTFSERGLQDHSSPALATYAWSFVAAAIETDAGLELRCGYGVGMSVTTGIPAELLLSRSLPDYERVRSLIVANVGARFRSKRAP